MFEQIVPFCPRWLAKLHLCLAPECLEHLEKGKKKVHIGPWIYLGANIVLSFTLYHMVMSRAMWFIPWNHVDWFKPRLCYWGRKGYILEKEINPLNRGGRGAVLKFSSFQSYSKASSSLCLGSMVPPCPHILVSHCVWFMWFHSLLLHIGFTSI